MQTKLQVSQPGDAFEREADRVADQVLRMPQPDSSLDKVTQTDTAPRVSRVASSSIVSSPSATPTVHDTLRDSGQPLDAATRGFFEPRFGHDFDDVRIHTNTKAAESAQSVSARAYTVGNNIAFNEGEYSPQSTAGQRLLAHELTHVVQQSQGGRALQRSAYFDESPFDEESSGSEESAFEDPFEEETGPEAAPERAPSEGQPVVEPSFGATLRVFAPYDPGWVKVFPMSSGLTFGETFNLPHFLKVSMVAKHAQNPDLYWVQVKEGRYDGTDVMINAYDLQDDPGDQGYAEAVYNVESATFYYGGDFSDPITTAATHPSKVPLSGVYDIQVPDYPHKAGKEYGPFATSWFLVGNGGDKYLHPGFYSLGCATIQIKIGDEVTWPRIWRYFIDARSRDGFVGRLTIYNPKGDQQLYE
ncbi:MAG TPA: DUF4157 domain-containing protein [Burkholderiales bacterium]|nr:DUF4157 domain-containing protein [Burkholderiales bacterium]